MSNQLNSDLDRSESVGRGRAMEALIRDVRAADSELGDQPDSPEGD